MTHCFLRKAVFGSAKWMIALGSVLASADLAHAQAVAGAQINGIVTDSTGGAVAGAQIKTTQTETGQVRTTISNTNGSYVFPNLPVGPYSLVVASSGFNNYLQSGIILQVGNNVQINVTLRVGDVSQEIRVSADASLVQTQDTSISQVVDQRRIVDLPLNGRQATQLMLLSGASITVPNNGGLTSSKNYTSSVGISVAGGTAGGNNYLLDGGDNNDAFSNVNLPYPFPDALQEFNVQTSGLSAEYGLHPGSVMNVVTKSGTNQFHGDLFEFLRNGDFNARNFFAAKQDTLRRNQFGGTIGGPVKKDKIFFFFGYQQTPTRTAPPTSIDFVPTAAAYNGDFSTLESAGCQSSHRARAIVDPKTLQPFPNGMVSPALFSTPALNLLKFVPSTSDPCGQLTFGIPNPNDEYQYIGRVDWTRSAKHSLFTRYYITDYNNPPVYDGKNVLTTTRSGLFQRAQTLVVGDTYSFSPSIVNTFHATGTRLRVNRAPAPNLPSVVAAGVNMYNFLPNFLDLSVTGDFGMGCGSCAPGHFNRNTLQLSDDVNIIRGRHQMSFGVDWIHRQYNEWNLFFGNGEWTFNGSLSGDPMLDFMLGTPSLLTDGNPEVEAFRQNYFSIYAQNNFQVTRRLNIHIGVRWEPFLPERDAFGRGSHFSFSDFVAGNRTSKYVNAPPGLFFEGDPGIPSSAYTNRRWLDFAPRVGLAWDPTGSGRQSIRASYGIFYDTPEIYYDSRFSDASPWGSAVRLVAPAGGFANPFAGYPGGSPYPVPFPPTANQPFPSQGVYINLPLNMHHTYVQQWGLSYQTQVAGNWLVSASYAGNKTTHMYAAADQNPAVYVPGTCNGKPCSSVANTEQRRLLTMINPVAGPAYSSIFLSDDGDNATYQALVVTAQHRFSHNFTLLTNYTYSHCLSDSQIVFNDLSVNNSTYQNMANRNADYGNCDADVRHNFNTSLVVSSPKFASRWMNMLAGGWQFAPLFTAHSGFWFSPATGVDNSLTGLGNDRANVVGAPYVRNTNTRQWISASAFVPNPPGTFGNAGRNSLLGPSFYDLDVSLSRYFPIRERHRVELRFEFFNATNHVNFSNPVTSLSQSTFGRIMSAGDPRILQFAAKYSF
jgi:Carboxypeptidase regulatory-like domain